MDEKTYKITLADETEISNLSLNGNNFISSSTISGGVFENNCSPIVINDGIMDNIHEHMELVQITEVNNQYWFILRDISSEELKQIKIQSDIAYLAMMSGIEL